MNIISIFTLYLKLKHMITLTGFDLTETKEPFSYELRGDFDGFLEEGFYIECFIDCEEKEVGSIDEENNDDSTGIEVNDITFWMFTIKNTANEEVNFSSQIIREIKNDLENEIIKTLEK